MKLLLAVNSTFNFIIKRYIKTEVKIKLREMKSSKNLALQYFDFYYAPLFGTEWNKIRLALLTGRKYTALVNNFSNDCDESVESLKKLGALNMFEFIFNRKQNTENSSQDEPLKIPKTLKVFCYDNGNVEEFPEPSNGSNKLLNYYCLDGASVLSAVALDVQKDDYVLDLCASPGGKTLVMLQTLQPRRIFCNDISVSRLNKMKNMLQSYLTEDDYKKYIETSIESSLPTITKQFDKVLVDAPCTNDRHSLFSMKNNIFSKPRESERTEIPKIQKNLLIDGIKHCKIGGTIVYSTCSLSPLQNEGVIKEVLKHFQNEKEFELKLASLEDFKTKMSYFFTFSQSCDIGILVIPEIQKNFGPLYICKLLKVRKNK